MKDLRSQVNTLGYRCLRWSSFVELAALLFVVSLSRAQTPPAATSQSPVIKSEVRIVLVDVVVTQGRGEPVAGLRKGDFQVTEDGRPQAVSFFEEHKFAPPKPVTL